MANTVSYLSFANTFGDWVVVTNALARENNDLAANNYVKPTGTLFLNSPTLGLQVANNAIVAGQLQVQGIGSSAYIQNNLRVDTQVYFQNTVLGLTNSGELISNGKISAAASGTGLAVSNNATIGGTLTVAGNETVGGTLSVTGNTSLANSLSVAGPTSINNTLSVTGDANFNSNVNSSKYITATFDVTGNRLIAGDSTTTGSLAVNNNASVGGQLLVAGNFVINGTTVYNTNNFTLNANSSVALDGVIAVNRGLSGANAVFRWTEANLRWEMVNVNNSIYYRVLTDEYLSSSTTNPSTTSVATSAAVAALQGVDNTQNTRIQSIETINTNQNTSISIIQGVDNTQNTRLNSIETINNNQNTSISIIQGVDATQNTRLDSIETNNINQNTAISIIQGVDATQNTRLNSIETINSNQNTTITQVNQFAAGAYNTANGANGLAAGAFNTANNRVSSVSGTSGRITSTGGLTPSIDLATAGPGATSATYSSVTIDAYGRVTALSSGTPAVTSIGGTTNQISVTGPTTTPTLTLPQSIATSSNVQFNTIGVGTSPDTANTGSIRATGDIFGYFSDDRLKTKLGNIENALDKLMSLNGFHYKPNETAQTLGYAVKDEVGLSAQEVQKVLPQVVVPAPIDEQYLTIKYERVVPLLVEAIKELKLEIDELKKSK
jgi:hypothetical protein